MIGRRKLAQLEHHYRFGRSHGEAALRCDVSVGTVHKYFRRFRDAGVPRGPVQRKRHKFHGLPVYTGPTWIGVPA